jgi:hypothetical protein
MQAPCLVSPCLFSRLVLYTPLAGRVLRRGEGPPPATPVYAPKSLGGDAGGVLVLGTYY